MADNSLHFDYPALGYGFEFNEKKPLFSITAQAPQGLADLTEITPDDFPDVEKKVDGDTTVITFTGNPYSGSRSMRVVVTLRRDGDEVLGSIELDLGGGFLVRVVRFPNIVWEPVEPFDKLLMSSAWGDNIERPTKTIRDLRGGEHSYIYPSELSMQYMTLHNPGKCVYISAYSLSDESFTLSARSIDDRTLAMSVNHFPFIEKGVWKSPECGFAILPGDWHAAADLYRSHMADKFQVPDVPEWMRNEFHGWVQVGMHFEGKEPNFKFKDLPDVYRRIQETGINTMHLFGWCGHGHDTEYPEYNPDPALGTRDELIKALDEIKSMGGHPILYTNARLIDPATDFYKHGGGKEVMCVNENGEPYIERYGTTPEFRMACPVCKAYQDKMVSEVGKIVYEFKPSAIQMDQVSCNYAFFCYNRSHPHPTPNTNFLPGLGELLQKIRQVHKPVDPDFFTWCEGCHERFGQYYDVNQGHGEEFTWQIGESTPEQFKYNYPDFIVTGICDGIQKLCHTYAQGKPFDFHLKQMNDLEFTDLAKQLVLVRKAYSDYFLHGVFRDNVGAEATGNARIFVINSKDGRGKLVNVWMPGTGLNVPVKSSIRVIDRGSSYKVAYPSEVKVTENGDWLNLEWNGPVATLIFE